MRKIIFTLLALSIAFSCQKKETEIKKTAIQETAEPTDCSPDFDTFFTEFSNDSVFQKNHIKFPLRSAYYGDANYDDLVVEIIKTKSDFEYIDFTDDKNAMQYETGKFTVEKEKSKTEVIYKLLGYDTGLRLSYKFKFINECWFLVDILDEST